MNMGKGKTLSLFVKAHQMTSPTTIWIRSELTTQSQNPPGMSEKSHIARQCDEREEDVLLYTCDT